MTQRSSIAKIIAVTSSLTLLGAYVWHSHITPNTPPPDPLGLSTIELPSEPEIIEFDGFVDYGQPASPGKPKGDDLRIISSKVINQPVFIVRNPQPLLEAGTTKPTRRRIILPGSKSYTPDFSRAFTIKGRLPIFDLFGEHKPPAPPP